MSLTCNFRRLAPTQSPDDFSLLDSIFSLRAEAHKASGRVPPWINRKHELWNDEHDDHACHFVVESGKGLLAAARLCTHNCINNLPEGYFYQAVGVDPHPLIACMSRLVVHPDAQGQGLAKTLDLARLAEAKKLQCSSLVGYTPS